MKKKIAKKGKNKFLKNLSPILGVILILVAVAIFAVAVRSNMTGNVAHNFACNKVNAGKTDSIFSVSSDCYVMTTKWKCIDGGTRYNFFCWTGCRYYYWQQSGTPIKGFYNCNKNTEYCDGRGHCNKKSTTTTPTNPTKPAGTTLKDCGTTHMDCTTLSGYTKCYGGRCCEPSCAFPIKVTCGQVYYDGCGSACPSRGTKCPAGKSCSVSGRTCIPNT